MTLWWTRQWIDDNAGELEVMYDMIIFGIMMISSLTETNMIAYNSLQLQ